MYIDDRFVAADLHITLGFIEPHLMLGYSGGRKLIAPGLAAQETIKVLHSPKFMRDPRAVEGSIEDNPLHRELVAISRMARHDFMLDVALARDRSIAAVFAGHPEEAHRRGVRFVSETMLETLAEPVDAVITTAAGYPLDLTLYQSIKGVTAASHIVKPGGHIVLMAACEEGVGADEFRRMLLAGGTEAQFLRRIEDGPVTVDQWQIEKLALVAGRQHYLLVCSGRAGGVPREAVGQVPSNSTSGYREVSPRLGARRDSGGDSGGSLCARESRTVRLHLRFREMPEELVTEKSQDPAGNRSRPDDHTRG